MRRTRPECASLAERNQEGALAAEEREELQNYVKAGHLLALLHSKARRSLKAKEGFLRTLMDESLARTVRERAGNVCEYCRMPQAYYPTVPFPIDHIIARQHGGPHDARQPGPLLPPRQQPQGAEHRRDRPADEEAHQALQSATAQVGAALSMGRTLLGRPDRHRSNDDRRPGDESSRRHQGSSFADRRRVVPARRVSPHGLISSTLDLRFCRFIFWREGPDLLFKPGESRMPVRPVRPPHHSVSDAGLVGGGTTPQPGEISMAHKGVLFLDEMPEFNRKTLEVLRQPLEEGEVTISRALRSTTFPAEFILVAAMNPCPCGYRSDPRRACSCTPPQVEKYLSKISGPLLDRIDLHVEVPAVPFTQLAEMPPGPTSADLRSKVEARRGSRSGSGREGTQVNGRMTARQVRKFCPLKPESMSLLKAAMEDLGLSARAHDKVLRAARTIADLDGHEDIKPQNIAEAVGYRSLDRSVWA